VELAFKQITAQLEQTTSRFHALERTCARLDVEKKCAQEEVERLRKELAGAGRQAGTAEVATGVLHNVGNVINNVNVAATLLRSRLRHSRVDNLSKALQLLREHRKDLPKFLVNDPKGRVLRDILNLKRPPHRRASPHVA
jgi:chromosome segregation ATPase